MDIGSNTYLENPITVNTALPIEIKDFDESEHPRYQPGEIESYTA